MRKTAEQRFWEKVDRRESDECWPWLAAKVRGYGSFAMPAEDGLMNQRGAHRVAFYFTHGHWPTVARHSCDTKECVNPAHILDGTHLDNMRDARERNHVAYAGDRCRSGHLYPDPVKRTRTGARICPTCRAIYQWTDMDKKKAKRAEVRAARPPATCPRGHVLDETARPNGTARNGTPARTCRICAADRQRARRRS